jgi:hypothetical protein
MRGGHQGFESFALSLITPPNLGGCGGSCFPSMVVVALGEPGTPVICCAEAGVPTSSAAVNKMTRPMRRPILSECRVTVRFPHLDPNLPVTCF